MKPSLPVASTSFISTQNDVSTPTISNRATPTKLPPPLSLENEIRQPTLHTSLHNSSSLNPTRPPATQRKPRFSNPTPSPIIVQRPLSLETRAASATASASGGLISTRPAKVQGLIDTWNDILKTNLVSNISNGRMVGERNGDDQMIFQVLLFAMVCDLLRTGMPYKILLGITDQMFRSIGRKETVGQVLFPSNRKVGRKGPCTLVRIRGIPNYGQTCFINSVLQSLASLEPFLKYLERVIEVQSELPSKIITMDGSKASCFSQQVLEVLDMINSRETGRRRPDTRKILKRIGETNSQFRSKYMEQQDAQELLQTLLGVIISDAELDSTDQRLRFLDDPVTDDDDNGLLTAVIAGDETRYSVNWSPSNSASLKKLTPVEGESDILTLSGLLERIDENQKNMLESAVRPSIVNHPQSVESEAVGNQAELEHQREEKKQEDFEIALPFTASDENLPLLEKPVSPDEAIGLNLVEDSTLSDDTASTNSTDDQSFSKESTSMQIMKSTISSITPSPLSGWLGSTLRCCKCKHVRPIQNAPFLDIPVVPTSIPHYLAKAHQARPPNVSPQPVCTLDQCLVDFTSVERVQDVECRSCTIQKAIEHFDEEAVILRGAISSMEKRIQQKGGDPTEQVKYLHEDLAKIELRLIKLKTMDPDEEEIMLNDDTENELLGIETTETEMIPVRCDAKKCLFLTRCPSILCCHVQRRYFDPFTNRMEKCVQFVEFPQVLDLGPYCAYGPKNHWAAGSSNEKQEISKVRCMPYRLQSIIEHRGNAYGGHYVSYRRDHSGEWFRISDNNVTPVSWQQVRSCQAYMLFYEAI